MDYRDKRDAPSHGAIMTLIRSAVGVGLAFSVLYGVGIPFYLAIKSTFF